jgi:hypothetical protein
MRAFAKSWRQMNEAAEGRLQGLDALPGVGTAKGTTDIIPTTRDTNYARRVDAQVSPWRISESARQALQASSAPSPCTYRFWKIAFGSSNAVVRTGMRTPESRRAAVSFPLVECAILVGRDTDSARCRR